MTITAKIVADSLSPLGRITTFELEYPRFIHSELMTHRLFSRNAASSRAIPVKTAIELIQQNTAMPIHWGKNQPGMSAKEECNAMLDTSSESQGYDREEWWLEARDMAILHAKEYANKGYHKQIVNRLLEPFTHIKVVLTATEFDNWFWLRNHEDAQPEIRELAKRMHEEYTQSKPFSLNGVFWHVPYYNKGQWVPTKSDADFVLLDENGVTLSDALAISSSCCAQVSYRKLDDSVEKARNIFARLVESMPPHFSPFEHQATPMPTDANFNTPGVTHLDRYGNYWSGNFKGWIQHRQFIMEDLQIEHMTSKPTMETNDE